MASLSSAISGNEKRLESLRQNIIKKTEDEQKELDSAQEEHQTIKQNIKDSQLKLSSLISARSQYDIEKDRDKYIENKNLMEREYAKLESLRKESEIQQKQVNEVKLKIRKAGLEEIKKDMLEVNKQDGFSSEQLNKATEELKQKQQSAIAEDRKSIRESKDAFATQERERAQERLREIFNPHIHSESLSKPVEYVTTSRAYSKGETIEFVDGSRSGSLRGISINKKTNLKTILHEYGHQIEDGNPEVHDLCTDFFRNHIVTGKQTLLFRP